MFPGECVSGPVVHRALRAFHALRSAFDVVANFALSSVAETTL